MPDKVWDKIFMEVCGSAIIGLKNDFANWTIGRHIAHTQIIEQFKKAYGTELALETTVTSYIAIEFAKSALTKGLIHREDNQKRFWELLREIRMLKGNDEKIVDFVVNRINPLEENLQMKDIPVLIEAKRFRRWKVHPNEQIEHTSNWTGIESDINSLLDMRVNPQDWDIPIYENFQFENYFTYLLVWDYLGDDVIKNDLNRFQTKITNRANGYDVEILTKWIPANDIISTDLTPPTDPSNYFFISLIEIRQKEEGQKESQWIDYPQLKK